MPGSAAAAFPARRFKASARRCNTFLTHFFNSSFGGDVLPDALADALDVPVIATTIVDIIKPRAVKIAVKVIPCSLK